MCASGDVERRGSQFRVPPCRAAAVTSQGTSGRPSAIIAGPSSCIRIDILPGKVIDATTPSNMGRPRAMISSLLFALFAPYRRCSSIRSGSSGLSVSSNNGPVGGTNEEYCIRCIWCCSGSWLLSDRRLPPRWMNAEVQDTRPPQGRKSGAGGLASPLSLTAILHCQHGSHLVQEGDHAFWPNSSMVPSVRR